VELSAATPCHLPPRLATSSSITDIARASPPRYHQCIISIVGSSATTSSEKHRLNTRKSVGTRNILATQALAHLTSLLSLADIVRLQVLSEHFRRFQACKNSIPEFHRNSDPCRIPTPLWFPHLQQPIFFQVGGLAG